jgi:hypothetical protein
MACCTVCCETLTKFKRAPVACLHCDFAACSQCVRTYILDVPVSRCMSCKHPWDDAFLEQHLTKTFMTGEYATHKKNRLFEAEKAKMPDTVDLAAKYKRYMEISKGIEEAMEDVRGMRMRDLNPAIDAWRTERNEPVRRVAVLRARAYNVLREVRDRPEEAAASIRAPRVAFACPAGECRGYVNRGASSCALCGTRVCSKCHAVAGEAHACDPDVVLTVQAMAKDTKPCPECAAPIFKVDGCDQMWCLACKTAFSWKTGEIERGRVHNPEYFRWMRERGQVVPRADGECQGQPQQDDYPMVQDVVAHWRAAGIYDQAVQACLYTAFFVLVQERFHGVPELRRKLEDPHSTLRKPKWLENFPQPRGDPFCDFRIRYLLGELDEEALKQRIYHRHRARERIQAALEVKEMLVAVGSTLCMRMLTLVDEGDVKRLQEEIKALLDYFNKVVRQTQIRFDCSMKDLIAPLEIMWDAYSIKNV